MLDAHQLWHHVGVAARRYAAAAKIHWLFRIEEAREKLGRAYPEPRSSDLAEAA